MHCTSSHCQSDSDDSHDLETSTEWKFEGHLYSAAGHLSAGKTYVDSVRASVEDQYLPTVPTSIPVYCMESFYNLAAEPDRELFKLPIQGYVQAKLSCRLQWRNWADVAALELEKIQSRFSLHGMYIFDTQEKTNPRNTNSFLLRWETQRLEEHAQHGPFPAQSVWASSLSGMTNKTWT